MMTAPGFLKRIRGAVSFVGGFEAFADDEDALTITFSGLLENDVVYVGFASSINTDVATPAGWTQVTTVSAGANNAHLQVFRKKMGAVPDASIVFAAFDEEHVGVAVGLRGVDQTTPEDATTTTANSASAGAPDSPSITTVTPGAWVLSFGCAEVSDASVTAPAGYENKVDINHTNITVMCATKNISSPGAEDPAAWTDVSGASWCAASVAVRPALS